MVEELKWEYNHNLTRFYNGCNYVEEHPETVDKYEKELFKIHRKLNSLVEEIEKQEKKKPTHEDIVGGFKI